MQATKQTITFITTAETRDLLDKVADMMDRDRSYVLNQAIESYLETYSWQIEYIEEGQKQARNGEFVSEQEWRAAFNRNR